MRQTVNQTHYLYNTLGKQDYSTEYSERPIFTHIETATICKSDNKKWVARVSDTRPIKRVQIRVLQLNHLHKIKYCIQICLKLKTHESTHFRSEKSTVLRVLRALKSRLGIRALIFLMTIVSFFNVPSSMRPSCSPTMREVLCSLDAPVVVLDVEFDIALPGYTHEKRK